jgi:hypothetical protein
MSISKVFFLRIEIIRNANIPSNKSMIEVEENKPKGPKKKAQGADQWHQSRSSSKYNMEDQNDLPTLLVK